MSDPLEPVDLDLFTFPTANGERRLGRPNHLEHKLAAVLMAAIRCGDELPLATVLAAVREGSTLEGPRSSTMVTVMVTRDAASDPRILEGAEASLWRRWVDELRRHHARPIGWPSVQRTHLDWRGPFDPPHPLRPDMTVVDIAQRGWGLLELRLECEVVPTTP